MLNTEEIEPFFFQCFGSLAQVDSWLYQPPPLAIQLSLKDSSCAVLDRTEGPLCAPAHRGTTVTAPETLQTSSHSSMLHTCGEFQANKFKGRVIYPEKH